jgi:D-tyrosyl-tRNA(Tyr) deacylase
MRALVQRVTQASVEVGGVVVGRIGPGLLVFVGVGRDDLEADAGPAAPGKKPAGASLAAALADKVANLRIFYDAEGKSNLSLLDVGGAALVISQFTLYADYRRGRRPSFSDAADPVPAEALVEEFRRALERLGIPTAAGRFAAHMVVSLVNDGPYTILVDTDALTAPRRGSHRGAPTVPTAVATTASAAGVACSADPAKPNALSPEDS